MATYVRPRVSLWSVVCARGGVVRDLSYIERVDERVCVWFLHTA